MEFGRPAVVAIAEAVADSSLLTPNNVCYTLSQLQGAFYVARDELPVDVPDDEIIEALAYCLEELSDASEVATMPRDEVMAFSNDYARATEAEGTATYRIVDDDGRAYTFDPSEWDYDEHAGGWDGEGWADGWDD